MEQQPSNHLSPVLLFDSQAEAIVIGACFNHRDDLLASLDRLIPEDFYDETNQAIFQAIREIHTKNSGINVSLVNSWLKDHGYSATVIGDKIGTFIKDTQGFWGIEPYLEIIKTKAVTRATLSAINYASIMVDTNESPTNVLEYLMSKCMSLMGEAEQKSNASVGEVAMELWDILEARHQHQGTITGVPSGFKGLDSITCGWQKDQPYIILAARPSIGKTTFAINCAVYAAEKEFKVQIFSIEMEKCLLVEKMISLIGSINGFHIRNGCFTPEEWSRASDALGKLLGSSIFIDDNPDLSVAQMRARANWQKAQTGLDLVIIDYIQLVKWPSGTRGAYEATSEISKQVKTMGRALKIPIIALSQLNRDVEKRESKKPTLADLRETGRLEQDGDIIVFLYPGSDEVGSDGSRTINLTIAKNRCGPLGDLAFNFSGAYNMFREIPRPIS